MDYKLDESYVKHLQDAHQYLNLVEVKGAANVGNLFQAMVRIEAILQKIAEEENKPLGKEKETPRKKEEKE